MAHILSLAFPVTLCDQQFSGKPWQLPCRGLPQAREGTFILTFLEAPNLRSGCQQVGLSLRPLFMAMFTAFLLCTCVPDAHLCVQGFSSRKDTSQAGMGLSLMASFNSVIS